MLRISNILLVLLILAAAGACRGGEDPVPASPTAAGELTPTTTPTPTEVDAGEEPTPSPTVDPALAVAAQEAIESFDADDLDASISALNEIVVDDLDIVPALAPYLEDDDPERRFAALYVGALLADSDAEAELLKPALADPLAGHRAMAAGSLIGLGFIEAIPVLIEELENDEPLPYDEFNRPISDLAQEALVAYTDQSLAAAEEWRTWWDDVGEQLIWDGERYVTE